MDIYLIYSLLICKNIILKKHDNKAKEKDLINLKIKIIFKIMVIGEFNIFMRISYFCSILFIPILASIMKYSKYLIYKRSFDYITLSAIIILLGLSCSRGHLSSFKFLLFK